MAGGCTARGWPGGMRGRRQFGSEATGKSALTRWVFIWKLRQGEVVDYDQFHDPTLAAAFR